MWTGRYRFYWHPPGGFERALSLGDSSSTVAEVAGLFARLDGQQEPLAGEQFSSALQERVWLFQRDHGLNPDGVVGVQTLLKLNEQLGIDATAAIARSRLRDGASALVQR
jgi:general secretion pathway protein A